MEWQDATVAYPEPRRTFRGWTESNLLALWVRFHGFQCGHHLRFRDGGSRWRIIGLNDDLKVTHWMEIKEPEPAPEGGDE